MTTPSRVCQTVFVCGRLWKLKHLQKNLPNLMSTSLLLMDTKSKCPGISIVLKRWIELYYFFKNYTMIQGLSMLAAPRDRSQVAPTYLPASCYLPECLDGAWHRPTGWLDKHSIDWLLDLPLMLVRGITKFLHFCFSMDIIPRKMEMMHHHNWSRMPPRSLQQLTYHLFFQLQAYLELAKCTCGTTVPLSADQKTKQHLVQCWNDIL